MEELEREKNDHKQESAVETRILKEKLYEFELEKNAAIRNEKLLEERMKFMAEDKEKQEKSLNDKWSKRLDEKD